MTTSCVKNLGGVPNLFINGEPVPGVAYITYFRENNDYAAFGAAGYRLFSIPVYFGDQTINPQSKIHPFEPGIFSERGKADFTILDRQIQQVLDAVPDAMIFPRVNMSMPTWWEAENPGECCFTSLENGPRRSCFSSEKWRADSEAMLGEFLDYAENAPYADHICAYMLSNGSTEEWFGFDWQGSDGPAARAAFGPGADPSNPAYRKFLSESAAGAIARFARFTKERTRRTKAIGCFYGYTFEVPCWEMNHHGLRVVLDSPDVDFLCSPDSYRARLTPGIAWPFMLPFASLQAAGKAYFCEYDTRTFLSKFPAESRENSCEPGTYRQPIWLGPATEELSRWQLQMNMGRQLALGHSSWWFDMWGRWYHTPAMMADMKRFRELVHQSLADTERGSVADCAVWIDDAAFAHVGRGEDKNLCRDGRFAALQSGISFDFYELGDWGKCSANYRAAVFIVPAETPCMSAVIAECERRGIPHLVLRPGDTPGRDAIRSLAVRAGAHCYIDSGDAVWVGQHYLVLHAASSGEKTVRLPRPRRIRPLFPDGEDFTDDVLSVPMQLAETRVWRLD